MWSGDDVLRWLIASGQIARIALNELYSMARTQLSTYRRTWLLKIPSSREQVRSKTAILRLTANKNSRVKRRPLVLNLSANVWHDIVHCFATERERENRFDKQR